MFKKLVGLFTVAVVGLLLSSVAAAQNIAGSAHDFSSETWNSGGEICIVCHTPHNADIGVAGAPLWNHEVTSATFTLYSSATLDASPLGQPDGASKLCLSCHDGTVAVDNFGGVTSGTTFISTGLVGIDLANDHPISFDYDDALATADGGLNTPSTDLSGLGGTIAADLLFADSLECASCHDVHNSEGLASLLRVTNAASALCLTCHNK